MLLKALGLVNVIFVTLMQTGVIRATPEHLGKAKFSFGNKYDM
jgi:hypothetical protein